MVKKLYHKILIIIMLMLFALSFCACSQIRVMTITNTDNSIDELVSITIDDQQLQKQGYDLFDIKNLKTDIEQYGYTIANNICIDLNQKIFEDLLKVTDEESVKVLNSYMDGVKVVKTKWQDNTFVIGIRFKNIDVYKYYYQIEDDIKIEFKNEEHFFYTKTYYYASTMYVKHHVLYDYAKSYFTLKYGDLVKMNTHELLYTYTTELRRQHSDADYIIKQDGKYYHTWVVDENKLEEPIMLYYNTAKPENYIIVSLCVALGLTVVLTIVTLIIKQFKRKKKEDET